MSRPTVEEILPPRSGARLRIQAYSIGDAAHEELLNVGQTVRAALVRNGFENPELDPAVGGRLTALHRHRQPREPDLFRAL